MAGSDHEGTPINTNERRFNGAAPHRRKNRTIPTRAGKTPPGPAGRNLKRVGRKKAQKPQKKPEQVEGCWRWDGSSDACLRPIDYRHQMPVPIGHRHVRDVAAPNLVRAADFQPFQKVRINLMPLARLAQVPLGIDGFDAHQLREPGPPACGSPSVPRAATRPAIAGSHSPDVPDATRPAAASRPSSLRSRAPVRNRNHCAKCRPIRIAVGRSV